MTTLLDDLLSRDPHRVWSATSALVTLRDPRDLDFLAANLPEIREKTANLDLGGALYPNNERLKFALHKLQYWCERSGCLCRLYPEHLMYDPKKEEQAGNIRILASESNRETWETFYTCACTICGTTYRVEEGEYHYTWWQWTLAGDINGSLT